MSVVARLKRVHPLDHVSGRINGVVFEGHGHGVADTDTGESEGEVRFDAFVPHYSVR